MILWMTWRPLTFIYSFILRFCEKKNAKPTVLIPVYNGDAWFKKCLESLALHKKHIENIVVSFNKSKMQRNDIKIFEFFKK